MKYIKRFEANFKNNITLYHGTCEHNANELLKNGWSPNQIGQGGNMGQPQYLYVSTEPEDALWFAEEKGCNTVLKIINTPIESLKFDPEDGCADLFDYSIDVALKKLENEYQSPIKFVITKPLGNEHFIKIK